MLPSSLRLFLSRRAILGTCAPFSALTCRCHSSKPIHQEWHVDESQLQVAESELQRNFPSISEPFRKPLLFLYAKGVFKNNLDQRAEFSRLLYPPSAGPQQSRYEGAFSRLEHLVAEGGDTASDNPDKFTGDSLQQAFDKIPTEWQSPDSSFIFFRDLFPPNSNVLVQRHQRSGLCYMHAPVVLQHYAVSKTKGTADGVAMVDIRRYMLQCFPASSLERHIFGNVGGSSNDFLTSILQPETLVGTIDATRVQKQDLENHGPLLVAGFRVFPDFTPKNHIYLDKPQGIWDKKSRHAMVLVGIREENGEPRFLLQNWWKDSQFLEMSSEYMERAAATLYYVKTPQTEIPQGFELSPFHFAETEAVDIAEQLDWEY